MGELAAGLVALLWRSSEVTAGFAPVLELLVEGAGGSGNATLVLLC